MGSDPQNDLLTRLLKDVSRSFYLTLRVLPFKVRRPLSVAYLLARTSDTIADTDLAPIDRRLDLLTGFRDCVLNSTRPYPKMQDLSSIQSNRPEWELLRRGDEVLDYLHRMEPEDRERIQQVLKIILSGQRMDIERFRRAGPGSIVALDTEQDLDDYTYRVAGCVGEFWTETCGAHLYRNQPEWDSAGMARKGIDFGKGLQLVNILRDLGEDLNNGRCYLPREEISQNRIDPTDFLNAEKSDHWRPLYAKYLRKAREYLREGWNYTLALPDRPWRIKLACSWPILIGVKTLNRLENEKALRATEKVKVRRKEVYGIMMKTLVLRWNKKNWDRLFESHSQS